jgi:hypothetical protein
MAKSQSLNIVIGADIENLKKGLDSAIVATQKAGKELSGATGEAIKGMQQQFERLASSKPSMATVRQMQQIAMTARALGPEFQDFANDVIRSAGQIQDAVGDMRAEVKYFASDTRRLDAVLGGIQGVAGAFGAVEGATAMLGIESKDLQKTMVQLQGAIALVNGLQAIQNALQAESAFMVGIQTAAVRIQTYVMGQATVAARAYATALVATGAGAILVAIGLIAAAMGSVKKETKEATEEVNNFTKAYEKQAEKAKKTSEIRQQISDDLLKNELNAAKLKGATESELAQVEINFLQKRKERYLAMLSSFNKGSADYLQYQRDISAIQNQIDEVTTESQIKNAEKRREKKKEQLKKENEDAIKAIHERHAGQMDAEKFLTEQAKKQQQKRTEAIAKSKELTGENLIKGTAVAPVLVQVQIDPKSRSQIVQDFDKLMTDMAMAVERLGEDIAISLGEALGNQLSGQGNGIEGFVQSVVGQLGNFVKTVGKMLIAYGISVQKFQTAFIQPQVAVAAGIAMVALGTAVANQMKQGPSVTAFADGGIVSGPTLGLMGEYPGARSNPEVIAPLDKLKTLMKPEQSSGYVAQTHISGRDLAIVLERYNKDSRRG